LDAQIRPLSAPSNLIGNHIRHLPACLRICLFGQQTDIHHSVSGCLNEYRHPTVTSALDRIKPWILLCEKIANNANLMK
jgi:hypothetical protein